MIYFLFSSQVPHYEIKYPMYSNYQAVQDQFMNIRRPSLSSQETENHNHKEGEFVLPNSLSR